jgi:regulatory protein
MKITAIDPHKRHPDWWHIALDGDYAFTLDGGTIVAEGLTVGTELGAQDVERLRRVAEERRLLDAALRYLTVRPRSRMEVRRRLLQRRPNRPAPEPELVERVLARLERMHQLDDRDFAEYWVEQRERFSPRAAYALQQELRQRGVDRETAEAAAEDEQDEERALAAARQRLRTLNAPDYEAFRTKLGSFLMRRGFRYGLAQALVRRLWEEERGERPDDDEDDAEE